MPLPSCCHVGYCHRRRGNACSCCIVAHAGRCLQQGPVVAGYVALHHTYWHTVAVRTAAPITRWYAAHPRAAVGMLSRWLLPPPLPPPSRIAFGWHPAVVYSSHHAAAVTLPRWLPPPLLLSSSRVAPDWHPAVECIALHRLPLQPTHACCTAPHVCCSLPSGHAVVRYVALS